MKYRKIWRANRFAIYKICVVLFSVCLLLMYCTIGVVAGSSTGLLSTGLSSTAEGINQYYNLSENDSVRYTALSNAYSKIKIDLPIVGYSSVTCCVNRDRILTTSNDMAKTLIKEYGFQSNELVGDKGHATKPDNYYHVILAHRTDGGSIELYTVYMKKDIAFPDLYYVYSEYRNSDQYCPYSLYRTSPDQTEVKTFGYNGVGASFSAILFTDERLDLRNTKIGITNGRLVIGNVMHSDADAWRAIDDALTVVVNGITALCFMACSVILMIQIFRLALSAGKPQVRSQALRGLIWTCVGIAGVSSAYCIFRLCYQLL